MYEVEKIWWYDPTGFATWHSRDDVTALEPARCVTIAQVIHENKQWIVTSASWSNMEGADTEYADITVIPKGCITKREPYHTKENTHNDMAHKQ